MNRIYIHTSATAQRSNVPSTPNVQRICETTAIDGSDRSLRTHAICCLLSLLLPVVATADGKMMPTGAFPAHITMPDQQALIHFTNGTERLVIETRFTGAGTDFAWVVPLPSQPIVESATTGLFPTLRYLFQPRVVHRVTRYYVGILITLVFTLLIRAAFRTDWIFGIVVLLVLLLLGALLVLPRLARIKIKAAQSSAEGASGVSILDRRVVGVFDTTTIASQDPRALQNWLRENGFLASADTDPVVASYVKDGWVFVAAKVRRDLAHLQTSTPHPLSFTFKTARPVYPVRLTGVNNGPLRVELYVFGPERASAPHFRVERCTRPGSKGPRGYLTAETPSIVHPLLRRWVGGSPVATKLSATLTPANMRQDIWLDWGPFREKKSRLYSQHVARTYAMNWGTTVFVAGLLFACLASLGSETNRRRLFTLSAGATVLGLALAGVLYLALPKTEVRLVRDPWGKVNQSLDYPFRAFWEGGTKQTLASARANLSGLTNSMGPLEWRDYVRNRRQDNPLLGGSIHEEDSPGNYTLRETATGLEFVTYDAQGGEHLLGKLTRRAQ